MASGPNQLHALPPRPMSGLWEGVNIRDVKQQQFSSNRPLPPFAPMAAPYSSRGYEGFPGRLANARDRSPNRPDSPRAPYYSSDRHYRPPLPNRRSYIPPRDDININTADSWNSASRGPPAEASSSWLPGHGQPRRDRYFQPSASWKRSHDDFTKPITSYSGSKDSFANHSTYYPTYHRVERPDSFYETSGRPGYSFPRPPPRPTAIGNYKLKERQARDYSTSHSQDQNFERPKRSSRSPSPFKSSRSHSSSSSRDSRDSRDSDSRARRKGKTDYRSHSKENYNAYVSGKNTAYYDSRSNWKERRRRSSSASTRSFRTDSTASSRSSSRTPSLPPAKAIPTDSSEHRPIRLDSQEFPIPSAPIVKEPEIPIDHEQTAPPPPDEALAASPDTPPVLVPGLETVETVTYSKDQIQVPNPLKDPETQERGNSKPEVILPAPSFTPTDDIIPIMTRSEPYSVTEVEIKDLPVIRPTETEVTERQQTNLISSPEQPPITVEDEIQQGEDTTMGHLDTLTVRKLSPERNQPAQVSVHEESQPLDIIGDSMPEEPIQMQQPLRPRQPTHELIQPADNITEALRMSIAAGGYNDLESREERTERVLLANLSLVEPPPPRSNYTTEFNLVNANAKIRGAMKPDNPIRQALISRIASNQAELAKKQVELRQEYLSLHKKWQLHCQRLDVAANPPKPPGPPPEESIGPTTRATRRSAAALSDAVRSDLEMEQIIASLGNDDLTDPNLLASRNLAKIPNMINSVDRDKVLLYDDTNGRVLDPHKFYHIRHNIEDWTEEEKKVFIRKYALYPKQFGLISTFLEHKSTRQCILFYYVHKKELIDFRDAVSRWGTGRKRKGGARKGKQKGNALLADIASSRRRQRPNQESPVQSPVPDDDAPRPRRRARTKNKEKDAEDAARIAKRAEEAAEIDIRRSGRRKATAVTRVVAEEEDAEEAQSSAKRQTPVGPRKTRKPREEDVLRSRKPVNSSYWTDGDKAEFIRLLALHGTNFKRISASMPNKTAIQLGNYYKYYGDELGLPDIAAKAQERPTTPDPTQADGTAKLPNVPAHSTEPPQRTSYSSWAEKSMPPEPGGKSPQPEAVSQLP